MDSKNFALNNLQTLTLGRAVFEKKLGGLSALRLGSEYWHTNYQPKFNDTLFRQIDNYAAAFAEASIYISKELAAQVGTRFEHSSLINKSDIAPRVSLAYKTGKNSQVSVAYGIFYQKPESQQLYSSTNVGFTKSTHYIMNYQKIYNQRTLRVEAYYKKYDELIKQVPIGYNYYSYNNSGNYTRSYNSGYTGRTSNYNASGSGGGRSYESSSNHASGSGGGRSTSGSSGGRGR